MRKRHWLCLVFWTVCAGAAVAQEKAEITGRVVDETGQPITGAKVEAVPVNASFYGGEGVLTDKAGRFRLFNLSAQNYLLQVTHPGYFSPFSFEGPRYRPGEDVTLTIVKGGVITGQVTDDAGRPVVGLNVKVRHTPEKGAPRFWGRIGRWQTDDRGVYRVYGLPAGRYHVFTGGGFGEDPYNSDAPVYYPAATSQAGAELVNVSLGVVTGNINIRYAYRRGRVISGQITGLNPQVNVGASATLSTWDDREQIDDYYLRGGIAAGEFLFTGLADGEDLLTVSARWQDDKSLPALALQRVTVKGRDVSGVILQPQMTGNLRGKLEWGKTPPPAPCENLAPAVSKEISLNAQAQKNNLNAGDRVIYGYFANTTPDASGEFTLRWMLGGAYRLRGKFPEGWFVRAATLKGADKEPEKLTAPLVNIKSGVTIEGLTLNLAPGAALLRGRVTAGKGDKTENWHLFLVPMANDENLWLYQALEITGREYNFANVAPGRYWLLARPSLPETAALRVVLDANERANLRREAEAANIVMDLTPCQRVTDFVLRYRPKL